MFTSEISTDVPSVTIMVKPESTGTFTRIIKASDNDTAWLVRNDDTSSLVRFVRNPLDRTEPFYILSPGMVCIICDSQDAYCAATGDHMVPVSVATIPFLPASKRTE